MRIYFLFILLIAYANAAAQSDCFENKTWPMPELSSAAQQAYTSKLAEARQEYEKDSGNAEAIIRLGRREAYPGNYKKAIDIFTYGISLHPANARLYRHRGHRYITLRCFDKAIDDFKMAAKLVKGKKDEIEPDGLPNAKNTPTSTLQSNIWYHLGLVYYIQGNYKEALNAYKECMRVSSNPDMYVATANWLYVTLRKLNKNKEAAKLLSTVSSTIELIENKDYLEVLLLYKQQKDIKDPVEFLQKDKKRIGACVIWIWSWQLFTDQWEKRAGPNGFPGCYREQTMVIFWLYRRRGRTGETAVKQGKRRSFELYLK